MKKAVKAATLAVFLTSLVCARQVLAQAEFPEAPRPLVVVLPGAHYIVEQQDGGGRMYVSNNPRSVTQFTDASWYGTIGLLAHDYLAGKSFKTLRNGSKVVLVYGDRAEVWRVKAAYTLYLSPQFTSEMAFDTVYRDGGLVFQTCQGDGYFFAYAELERTIRK